MKVQCNQQFFEQHKTDNQCLKCTSPTTKWRKFNDNEVQVRKLDCYEQFFAQINMYVTKKMCFKDHGCYDEAKKFILKNMSAFYYDINVKEKTIEFHKDVRPKVNLIEPGTWKNLYEFSKKMSELDPDPERPDYLQAGCLQEDDEHMELIVSLNHIIGDAGYVKFLFHNVERYLNGEIVIDEMIPTGLPETPCSYFPQIEKYKGKDLIQDFSADFSVPDEKYVMMNLTKQTQLSKKPRLINQVTELIFKLAVEKLIFKKKEIPKVMKFGQFVDLRHRIDPKKWVNCLNFIGYSKVDAEINPEMKVSDFVFQRHKKLLDDVHNLDCFYNFTDLFEPEKDEFEKEKNKPRGQLYIDVSDAGIFNIHQCTDLEMALTAPTSLYALNLTLYSLGPVTSFLFRWGKGECSMEQASEVLDDIVKWIDDPKLMSMTIQELYDQL